MKRSHPDPAAVRIERALEAGASGTCTELAAALGMKQSTAYAALRVLADRGVVEVVDRIDTFDRHGRLRAESFVYAKAPPPKPPQSLVETALATRREQDPIHTCWWPTTGATTGAATC